jgi:hypothetical protein
MSFYDLLDVMQYRADWLETHPDEVLDDATVIDCLRDEHSTLVEALIAADIENDATGSGLFQFILREGFEGYDNMNLRDLWQELNDRGLTI